MKLNRKWMLVIALVMSMAMATGGTLAYLTATETEVNTFTIGMVNIDLEEPHWPSKVPTLLPGIEIQKDPQIKNTGNTEAWVWMEVTIPNKLFNLLEIDWNENAWKKEVTTGANDTVVTMKREAILKTSATTDPAFTKVLLPTTVVNKDLEGISTLNIKVTAYAIQDAKFADIDAAIAAYKGNSSSGEGEGGEAETATEVATADELKAALAKDEDVKLTANINMNGKRIDIVDEVVIDLNGYTLTSKDGGDSDSMAIYVQQDAKLTLKDSSPAGTGEVVSSCYGVYVKQGATFIMDGGKITVTGNNAYDFGVTLWNGKFVMNGGTIVSRYGVFADDRYYSGVSNITINGGSFTSEEYDVDVLNAPDATIDGTNTNNLKVNRPEA